MSRRVAYISELDLPAVVGLPHTVLGRRKEECWVSLSDEVLKRVEESGHVLPLLYLSEEDYQQAIRDLPPEEVERVILQRLKRWAPELTSMASSHLLGGLKLLLVRAALARKPASRKLAPVLEAFFIRTLERASRLYGVGLYDDIPLDRTLTYTLEVEALLLEEMEALPEEQPAARPVVSSKLMAKAAPTYSQWLVELGHEEFKGGLPYVDLQRVYFITPADPGLLSYLRRVQRVHTPWKSGVVAAWPRRKLEELRESGKSAELLFLSDEELLRALDQNTLAQLQRELEASLEHWKKRPLQVVQAHWWALRLDQALRRRCLLQAAYRTAPAYAAQLRAHVDEETQELLHALALHPPGAAPAPASAANRLAWLREALSRCIEDAELLARRSKAEDDEESAERFQALIKELQPELAKLKDA